MGVTGDAELVTLLFPLPVSAGEFEHSTSALWCRIGTCCRHPSYGQSLQAGCGFPRTFPRDCSVKQTTTSVSVYVIT